MAWDDRFSVRSADGTAIAIRMVGKGPGLVLLQGAMGSAQTFSTLAASLSDAYSVYVPEPRGLGDSGPAGPHYTVAREVEDLRAIVERTGAPLAFGLSRGALILLEALTEKVPIDRAILFEPPLSVNGSYRMEFRPRYEAEMRRGQTAKALVTLLLGSKIGPAALQSMPPWLLEAGTWLGMWLEDRRGSGDYLPMRQLAAVMENNLVLVQEMAEKLDRFVAIDVPVLLLGGSQSPDYLKTALTALKATIPHATRYEIQGVGHAAPWNADRGGRPALVAEQIRAFLLRSPVKARSTGEQQKH